MDRIDLVVLRSRGVKPDRLSAYFLAAGRRRWCGPPVARCRPFRWFSGADERWMVHTRRGEHERSVDQSDVCRTRIFLSAPGAPLNRAHMLLARGPLMWTCSTWSRCCMDWSSTRRLPIRCWRGGEKSGVAFGRSGDSRETRRDGSGLAFARRHSQRADRAGCARTASRPCPSGGLDRHYAAGCLRAAGRGTVCAAVP